MKAGKLEVSDKTGNAEASTGYSEFLRRTYVPRVPQEQDAGGNTVYPQGEPFHLCQYTVTLWSDTFWFHFPLCVSLQIIYYLHKRLLVSVIL